MMKLNTLLYPLIALAALVITTAQAQPQSAPEPSSPSSPPADNPNKPQSQIDRVSYTLGSNIGRNLRMQGFELNTDFFMRGLQDGLKQGDQYLLTQDEMHDTMMRFQQELQEKQAKREKELAEKNAKEAKEFLARNAKQKGVKTTKSGLQYKILKEGPRGGKSPKLNHSVTVHYTGRLLDKTVFDSSIERGQPATFPVNGVIKGWTEALQMMKPGDKWELYIPPELAYGEQGAGGRVPPNALLIFEVELISVSDPAEPQQPTNTSGTPTQ
ncbi:MAG: FKBP-type peptidyl-prolyl cis-trans isomerase [Methylacidiphilales bacterium]|nr:FKBP-type peptidyl-prolyl cis-trans isomerase [Candidatus Methylacidiphilales bacterium]MDW8349261.1 FKBP-type peptidyl-prolyl cis-trans isomerase [Verrucomicrobiae bacterium]